MNKKQIDIDKINENKSIDKQKSKNIILKKYIKQRGEKILKPGIFNTIFEHILLYIYIQKV